MPSAFFKGANKKNEFLRNIQVVIDKGMLCNFNYTYIYLVSGGEKMGQVTIYLDNEIENKMKHAARENHVSVSKWVANIIKERISTEWPRDIVNLAGSWRKDFPSLAEIRSTEGEDTEREVL
jgi:hypothetical protein